MQTKQNWLSTAINYKFVQPQVKTALQQHFSNVIANPSDDQVLAVGEALANLSADAQLVSAELTIRSTIIANN